MGLFSSKKTYVDSVIMNMAGDPKDRMSYLKTTVSSHVIMGTTPFMSDTIRGSYSRGSGVRLKSYFRWATTPGNYNTVGAFTATLQQTSPIDLVDLAPHIREFTGQNVELSTAETGSAEYSYWADKFMVENYPELLESSWISDYIEDTGEIKIVFEDNSEISFVPDNFDRNAEYIYATFNTYTLRETEPMVVGPVVPVANLAALPSVAGWTVTLNQATPLSLVAQRRTAVTETFSDDRPIVHTETMADVTVNYTDFIRSYRRKTYMGEDPTANNSVWFLHEYMTQQRSTVMTYVDSTTTSTVTVSPGVTKTVTTKITEPTPVANHSYAINSQREYPKVWGPLEVFIYRIGSGNPDLDGFVSNKKSLGEFLPLIPLQINNRMVTASNFPAMYPQIAKAYKKAMGGAKVKDLQDDLRTNPNYGDMDYVFAVFGVSLNVRDNSCRKYLFEFFNNMRTARGTGWRGNLGFGGLLLERLAQNKAWDEWKAAQKVPSSALFGKPEPKLGGATGSTVTRIQMNNSTLGYKVTISWTDIELTYHTGLGKTGAKKGDCWLSTASAAPLEETIKVPNYSSVAGKLAISLFRDRDTIYIVHQVDEDTYRQLRITGLKYVNNVYSDKNITISGHDALNDSEESGFVVPLHYPTFRSMSMVDSTQMGSECAILMVNCYKVVKVGFFKKFFGVFLFLAVIAITVATGGAGAATVGLLGANAAVGAAIGLVGFAAVLMGAVLNAIAAMIVMKLVMLASTAVFGDVVGNIIGTVLSVVAVAAGTSMANGGSFGAAFTQMSQIDVIMNVTSALSNGYVAMMGHKAQKYANKTQEVLEDYADKSKKIDELYAANIGYGMGAIDPTGFVDNSYTYVENSETFLGRTLMTGSDLINMQMAMITDFTRISLDPKLI